MDNTFQRPGLFAPSPARFYSILLLQMAALVRQLGDVEEQYNLHMNTLFNPGLGDNKPDTLAKFNSETERLDDTINAIKKEIRMWAKVFDDRKIKIYKL